MPKLVRRMFIGLALGASLLGANLVVAHATTQGVLTVTPNTELTDGQTVHATFSSYPPNSSNAAVECDTPNPTAPQDCLSGISNPDQKDLTFAQSDGSGAGSFDIKVFATVNGTDCNQVKTCVILLASPDESELTTAPLAFVTATATTADSTVTTAAGDVAGTSSNATTTTTASAKLANTGSSDVGPKIAIALAIVVLGGAVLAIGWKRKASRSPV